MKKQFFLKERGNTLIASEKLIKVYLLWPIRYRLNKKSNYEKKKNHTALQDSVRGYIREISVAMFLQIQTDIYIYIYIYMYIIKYLYKIVYCMKLCSRKTELRILQITLVKI